jgi:hypothetical protein
LRAFETEDADSFVELLPGPRDRDGLPECLRFWKSRIEQTEADQTFSVGLIYGPSGCGKSSLLKAGILPRLAGHVLPLYIESTPANTESQLASLLARRVPELPAGLSLAETLAHWREERDLLPDDKLLIILDQFEQWLHVRRSDEDGPLLRALRQCDGGRVQCILIARDDFWMSTTRLMRALEVAPVEGRNVAAVDLFDLRHARKVLAAFGRALESLPPNPRDQTREQGQFLDQAVAELAEAGKVVCVQLSLFAEMVKDKSWTPATLRALGGAQRIGVKFLEESFAAPSAPAAHRCHLGAVRGVLDALLPEMGMNIKGHFRSRRELLVASGYADRPQEFDALLHILVDEIRLLTLIDPFGTEPSGTATAGPQSRLQHDEPHYQLTHDDLVPAVREWLLSKQKETRRGRAEIRLAERTALWDAKREPRQLPSFGEWLGIRLFTRKERWNEHETRLMQAAAGRLGRLALVWSLVLIVGVAVALGGYARVRASALLDRLYEAEIARVPTIVREMAPFRRWLDSRLEAERHATRPDSKRLLYASLALLPVDPEQADYLAGRLLDADPTTVGVIRDALASAPEQPVARFWKLLEDARAPKSLRIRAAAALAAYEPDSPRWEAVAPDIVTILAAEDLFSVVQWWALLHPIEPELLAPLRRAFRDQRGTEPGYVAACLLAESSAGRPELLSALIPAAEPRQLRPLVAKLTADGATLSRLRAIVAEPSASLVPDDPAFDPVQAQVNALLTLWALGHSDEVQPLLAHRADPSARTLLIDRLGRFGIDPMELVGRLGRERDPAIRQALVLSLGEFENDLLPPGRRGLLAPTLRELYRDDSDPGVHSALEWLLRRWSLTAELEAVERRNLERGTTAQEGRAWYVTPEGHTMVVIDCRRPYAPGRPPHPAAPTPATFRGVDRTIAVASKEVTVAQFLRFRPDHPYLKDFSPEESCPINKASWFDAARYCRWLSEQEHIPEDQMCYPPVGEINDSSLTLPPDLLQRTGYRLPTELEWEIADRAGTTTPWSFGGNQSMLRNYGWCDLFEVDRLYPVGTLKPNDYGLFDMIGNAYEFCLDAEGMSPAVGPPRPPVENPASLTHIQGKERRVLRGGAAHREAAQSTSTARNFVAAADRFRNTHVGFRVVRTCP